MKSFIVGVLLLLIVGFGAFIFFTDSQTGITGGAVASNIKVESKQAIVKTFVVTGENFKFYVDGVENPDIVVKRGDTVRIEFTSVGGFHDWKVDEFNVATAQVKDTDGETFVEFVADKTGTFEYYCSVGKHRDMGMKGNLIVG